MSEKSDALRRDISEKAEIGQLIGKPGFLLGDVPPPKKSSEYLQASLGWVYACVGVIADECASMKLKLFKRNGDDVKEVTDHPALDIIFRANGFTTQFDHFWLTWQYLELTGEAPWFVSFKGGRPDQLLLLRPDGLEVVMGTGDQIIGGYKYQVGGKKIPLEPKEVVFLRYPNPDRQFRGLGPLQAAARTIDIEEFSEEYNRRFFYNSGRPDGVLSTEQKLGKDQLERVEKKLAMKYRGVSNAHKTLILEKGLKWQPMGLSQKDMDFLNQMQFTRDKILGIFRVPRTVLGITDDVNRANAEATDYVFSKRTIKPKMERLIQQLNEFLLPLFSGTENMFYDFDDPVPNDKAAELERKKAALQYGWMTINEIRETEGLDPVEGGDVIRIPASLVELGEESVEPKEEPRKDFSERIKQTNARGRNVENDRKMRSAIEKELTSLISKMLGAKGCKPKRPRRKAETPDDPKHLALQAKQLNLADEFESKYKAGINNVFKEELNEILNKMPAKGLKAGELNWRKLLLLPSREKKRFSAELSSLITRIIVAQASEAFSYLDVPKEVDENWQAINEYFKVKAFYFAQEVTAYTNAILARQFKEGISKGESIPQLRRRVNKVFGRMEKYRSDRIARSETIKATNYASEAAYIDSGVVEAKQWLTAVDERTCEFCAPMNGKRIALGDKWFNKGETMIGDQGGSLPLSYESIEFPPLHPNCRCTLVPVVTRGKQDNDDEKLDEVLDKLESK